jgi:lipopolysaccharide/colanic/teichoic acid biosynthesis glycosyltransferase
VIYLVTKRAFDIAVSFSALVALAPVMAGIACAIKLESPGPVLYRGKRAGLRGKPFWMYKFRSMVVDAESIGGFSTAVDDPRLTRIGRKLRRYKLDELPQFLNVLKGEMSLVGPRPQVFFYTDRYVGEEKAILLVKPGITDFASLYFSDMDATLGSGDVDDRYAETVEPVKNRLRLRYVRERSMLVDVRILIETACKLIGIDNATGLDISRK